MGVIEGGAFLRARAGEPEWACDGRGTVLESQAVAPVHYSADTAVSGELRLTVADTVVRSSLKAATGALAGPSQLGSDRQWCWWSRVMGGVRQAP